MTGVLAALAGRAGSGGGGGALDTQTVTVGAVGTALQQDRVRGYLFNSIGFIDPGTSAIYGETIAAISWVENGGAPYYAFAVAWDVSNSGWTTMTISKSGGGTRALNRASASYGSGFWYWTTADTAGTQVFGTSGTATVTFT